MNSCPLRIGGSHGGKSFGKISSNSLRTTSISLGKSSRQRCETPKSDFPLYFVATSSSFDSSTFRITPRKAWSILPFLNHRYTCVALHRLTFVTVGSPGLTLTTGRFNHFPPLTMVTVRRDHLISGSSCTNQGIPNINCFCMWGKTLAQITFLYFPHFICSLTRPCVVTGEPSANCSSSFVGSSSIWIPNIVQV